MTISIGQVYRHYKGEIYIVNNVATCADNCRNGKTTVIYAKASEPDKIYSRLEEEFFEILLSQDKIVPRFTLIEKTTAFYKRLHFIPSNNAILPIFNINELKEYFSALEEMGYSYTPEVKSAAEEKLLTLRPKKNPSLLESFTGPRNAEAILFNVDGVISLVALNDVKQAVALAERNRINNVMEIALLNNKGV